MDLEVGRYGFEDFLNQAYQKVLCESFSNTLLSYKNKKQDQVKQDSFCYY